jgi:uncharacterized protein YbjT (DUF2867 family)
MAAAEPKMALLAGASGLVGSFLLDALLEAPDFARVFAVTRRPLGREHPRLANRIVVDFEELPAQLKGTVCHVAFCCLGTTIRQAGSQDAFREVDFDHVMSFAAAAKAAQARRFVVVSSAKADPTSKSFYLRIKGELEGALATVGFESLDILQPSLLLGWRNQMRPAELAARLVAPVVNPFLFGERVVYRAIPARTVASAMIGAVRLGRKGVQKYTYTAIQALAKSKPARASVAA